MNIFILDQDPKTAAQYHCDKHVTKMILESAQLLCTALNDAGVPMPYKSTHKNHPCAKWVRESRTNALWLLDLTEELNAEYKYRYNKFITEHKSYAMLKAMHTRRKLEIISDRGWTSPALAMPDVYKCDDVVSAYRAYYRGSKTNLLSYTKRTKPEWL